MNIIEATRKAMERGRYMTRGAFADFYGDIKIQPTNTDKCCVILKENKPSAPRWEPKAEDLTADDWRVVN